MERKNDIDAWEYKRILNLLNRAYKLKINKVLQRVNTLQIDTFIELLEHEALQYEYPEVTLYDQLQKECKVKQSLMDMKALLMSTIPVHPKVYLAKIDNIINIIDHERIY